MSRDDLVEVPEYALGEERIAFGLTAPQLAILTNLVLFYSRGVQVRTSSRPARSPIGCASAAPGRGEHRGTDHVHRVGPFLAITVGPNGVVISKLENSCLLVVVGARDDGRKELLAMELGYRESARSWATVLRDLRDRGLEAPLLACGDGALGLWAALDEVFPTTRHQRCWNHRVLNVLDKVPKRLWPETRRRLRECWSSESRAECELRRDALVRWLEAHGQTSAAETVLRDWDDFVTFYDFPAEHWIHLRTSNPIESLFAGVRLRTDVAKRMRRRENALYLVFKVAQRLEHSWRPLNGGLTVMTLLLGGARFVDGVYVPQSAAVSAA